MNVYFLKELKNRNNAHQDVTVELPYTESQEPHPRTSLSRTFYDDGIFFSCTVPYDSHKLFMATEHLTCGHSDHRTEFSPLFHFYPFEFKKPHVANSHCKAQYSPRGYFFIQGEREGNNVQRNHYF